jgi:hypothetical protein
MDTTKRLTPQNMGKEGREERRRAVHMKCA